MGKPADNSETQESCDHSGETGTYCTKCWTNLHEAKERAVTESSLSTLKASFSRLTDAEIEAVQSAGKRTLKGGNELSPEDQRAVQSVAAVVATELRSGIRSDMVARALHERGLTRDVAEHLVRVVSHPGKDLRRDPIGGILFIVAGAGGTLAGLAMGNIYIVLGGLIALVRGVYHGFMK